MGQKILTASRDYQELDAWFHEAGAKTVLLVCGRSIRFLRVNTYFDTLESRMGVKVVKFDGFQPNPLYESVIQGVKVFQENGCDSIAAVGGGSAMDVAKCIKLYSNRNPAENFLWQEIVPNDVKFLAMPTTAGTGSEATRYAVIYYHGEKQSVADYSCIPSAVLLDASVLTTLPEYQKKSTMMDALCHAVESFWSVNSTEESRAYSREAVRMILENRNAYLANEETGNANMLRAANISGKAINISQTTAGHAMCYKLTSLYGIAHGHAAALCLSKLWPYMVSHTDRCVDPRGTEYLKDVFVQIAEAMGCKSIDESIELFQEVLEGLALPVPQPKSEEDFQVLAGSVNTVRLKNNPAALDIETINMLYHQILMC